jgi:DNA recombination protein RmuC
MTIWLIILSACVGCMALALLWAGSRLPGSRQAEEQEEAQRRLREDVERQARETRQELAQAVRAAGDTQSDALARLASGQQQALDAFQQRLDALRENQTASADRIRGMVDERLNELRASNEQRLDQMRQTVEEQLQGTLEKRLGESFRLVSERLEAVQRGLGEMQHLANGVGDLKRVLTNVKARGTWAEVELGLLLEQILTPAQFDRNCKVRPDSADIVEFAVRLPGPHRDDPTSCVRLPIDAKFPKEDYDRLQEASTAGDAAAVERAADALAAAVRKSAQDIQKKYIAPPHTTDFAVLFLPTEGLYAEVLRRPGFADELLQRYRVVPAGPTTLAALLSSLRMGFRTLAIEQRASEVWQLLSAVKLEFGKFGDRLERLRKNLETAQNTVADAQTRTRVITRRLSSVENLPGAETLLALDVPPDEDDPPPPVET